MTVRRKAWLWVAAGFCSLLWFLVRVIPKPSRAAYPCQRAAAPLASGFIVWLAGLAGVKALHRRAHQLSRGSRLAAVAAVLTLALCLAWLPLGVTGDATAQGRGQVQGEPFTPSEPPNTPMGIGRGVHPGRVVWVREPDATNWDGKTGNWWDDACTNQTLVNGMLSKTLLNLTGEKSDKQAWDALFRYFNQTHNQPNRGYQKGEKIAIKINSNQDRSAEWGTGRRPLNGMPSPQAVWALVNQLITAAGVPGEDISIYEAAGGRTIGAPIYAKIRAGKNPEFQAVRFVTNTDFGLGGRLALKPDMANPIRFSKPDVPTAYLPQSVTESKYLINMALFRAHTMAGVTLCAKNHFGSLYFPDNGGWTPSPLHNFITRTNPMGVYNPLVDLIGHRHLGGKTLLYLIDGLYSAEHNEANVTRFTSFGDDWSASLFASQDPVAIDSVALDFLRNEPKAANVRGFVDNYLHEAALAAKPPSGTVYDPEKDGTPLGSLGVHEHWNNPTDKQYSRNLKRGDGIELLALTKTRTGK